MEIDKEKYDALLTMHKADCEEIDRLSNEYAEVKAENKALWDLLDALRRKYKGLIT